MNKKKINLTSLIFMALCCDMGIIAKKLIAPAANVITEYLHIPGGIGSSFAIMFIVIGAFAVDFFGCATLMCFVQSIIAFLLGTSGSMGMLVFIAYVIPGIAIDIALKLIKLFPSKISVVGIGITNGIAALSAAVCGNLLTFQLKGFPLWLYFGVAFTTGLICGVLASFLLARLSPVINRWRNEGITYTGESGGIKSRKGIIILICSCLVLIAATFLINRVLGTVDIPENMISIEGRKSGLIKLSEIDTSPIKRQIVSKKNKTRKISGEGIDLFELVADYSGEDFTEIIVISNDEYKATVSKEEALKKENAVLVFEGNSARLYVFGDTDSKRNVSNVKRIIIN